MTDVSSIQVINSAVKHIANLFLCDGEPQTLWGLGKLSPLLTSLEEGPRVVFKPDRKSVVLNGSALSVY